MMTFLAPAFRCMPALSFVVKSPVHSSTMSTPSAPHGSFDGSRSAHTLMRSPSMTRLSPSTPTGGDSIHREAEVLEQGFGRRGMAEAVDPDHRAPAGDVTPPALGRAGFDCEPRTLRGQHVVSVFLALTVERLRARHGHDARRD